MKLYRLVLLLLLPLSSALAKDAVPAPPADFKGKIALDFRDSEQDWGPFTPARAPAGSPNVLFIL